MIKYRVQLRSVSNVAASKTALIDIPCGQRFHQIILQHGFASGTNTIAGACTNIPEIRVLVNSRVQRVMSGTQLRDMNLLNGSGYDGTGLPNTAPGVSMPIYLAEPWRDSPADQDALAWASAGWQTFQIQVDLSTASTPTLVAWAVCDDFVPAAGTTPGICKWIRASIPAAGTSFDVTTIDRRDWLQQISLYPDSGGSYAATSVTFKRGGITLHELSQSANNALLNQNGMNPANALRTGYASGPPTLPGIYDLVFDHDGLLGSAVPMDGARDSLLSITAGTAMSGTVTAIIQRLGPPE